MKKIQKQKFNVDPATELEYLIWMKNGETAKKANAKSIKRWISKAFKSNVGDLNEVLLKINDYSKTIVDKAQQSNSRVQRFVISFSDYSKELRNGAVRHLR